MERPFEESELYGEITFADVTVKFSGRELRAHKVILGMRSKYFKRALAKDGGFKEAQDEVLELHDDDPDALESLLRYIYTSQYPVFEKPEWEKDLKIAVVADKYGLETLQATAVKRLVDLEAIDNTGEIIRFLRQIGHELPVDDDKKREIFERQTELNFRECFKDGNFRAMLNGIPEIRDELCIDNLSELVGLREFWDMLELEPGLAAKYLGKAVQDQGNHLCECAGCGNEDGEDVEGV